MASTCRDAVRADPRRQRSRCCRSDRRSGVAVLFRAWAGPSVWCFRPSAEVDDRRWNRGGASGAHQRERAVRLSSLLLGDLRRRRAGGTAGRLARSCLPMYSCGRDPDHDFGRVQDDRSARARVSDRAADGGGRCASRGAGKTPARHAAVRGGAPARSRIVVSDTLNYAAAAGGSSSTARAWTCPHGDTADDGSFTFDRVAPGRATAGAAKDGVSMNFGSARTSRPEPTVIAQTSPCAHAWKRRAAPLTAFPRYRRPAVAGHRRHRASRAACRTAGSALRPAGTPASALTDDRGVYRFAAWRPASTSSPRSRRHGRQDLRRKSGRSPAGSSATGAWSWRRSFTLASPTWRAHRA